MLIFRTFIHARREPLSGTHPSLQFPNRTPDPRRFKRACDKRPCRRKCEPHSPSHAVRWGRSLAHCLWRCRRRRRHRRAWYVPAIPSRRAQVGSVKSRCKPATGAWMLRYGTLVCLVVPGAVDSLGTLALHKALANEFVFWVRHNPS